MECLNVRRSILASPRERSPRLVEHLAQCSACAIFARHIEGFESKLLDVIHVNVPEGLAEQIILRHSRSHWMARIGHAIRGAMALLFAPRARLWSALGAGIAITVAVAVNDKSSQYQVADALIAHVVSEPTVLAERSNIEPVRFDRAIAEYGGKVIQSVGVISHLGDCVIDGVVAKHILVETPYGMATLVLIPHRSSGLPEPRTKDGFSVILVPLNRGTLGIITDSPQKARQVESMLMKKVAWMA